jgi:hypothetical protein
MELNGNKIKQKLSKKYCCEKCQYNTDRKSNLENHLLSSKHILELNGNEIKQKLSTKHNCEKCNKIYETSAGLWKHKKKCFKKEENNLIESENNISPELILNIIQQNQEFKDLLIEQNKIMMEMSKNNSTTNINNTNINNSMSNSNNKTFNLQVFLNETCKDAMNIMDFVDSIKISLSDIESIGELGFVNGMSKLIIKHLNALDENMRPVHCNDLKRSSLFVKDANVWAKEDDDNNKLKKAIRSIAHKNICALPEWRKKYPDCIYSESKKSDQYNHIVIEAMGGSGDNDDEKADKIISKIAKTVTIDKKN